MESTVKDRVLGFVRTILGALGFFFIGKNFFGQPLDENTFMGVVGVLLSLAMLVWSIADKTLSLEKWESAVGQVVLWVGGFIVSRGWLTNEQWLEIAGIAIVALKYLGGLITRKKAQALADPTNREVTIDALKK